ncbi:uncharacterized protein YkwD [Actinocorallia herbida]|uniref:Uncharacterized protein YkwD n=1 Tax=Actinocorallia herbida TaxID=58109 RepID=A0A3N1D766_9ACTN|nr:CAP domain-containing protein [Actinocorallia herbida]ROO89309.1 uncharacterized protein YkwD [Actinocorallia herbida]
MTPKLALIASVSALVLLAGCGSGGAEDLAASSPRASESQAVDGSGEPTAEPSKTGKSPDGGKDEKKKKSKKPTPKPSTAKPKKPKTTPTVKPTPKPKPSTPPPVATGGGMTKVELKVLQLTNAERAKAGCAALKPNARLARAAQKHSKDMAVNDYFSHDSQDGRSPWDRIKAEGYTDPGAENIAAGYPTAAAVVKGWMNSAGHKANILNCKLKALGVGEYKNYWTQDFGWT